ncbi:MAG: fumarylacetoacetate hydrolase family protein, partial [Alphaproteobacteria bacterium]
TSHLQEMGGDPAREPPFFFMKPAGALVAEGGEVPFPLATNDLHHEVELVVALNRGGSNIAPATAESNIFGYAVGIDLTRRDIQSIAKQRSWPWDAAKGLDHGAPCGALHTVAEVGHPKRGAIALDVDGSRRQEGDLAQMIWSVPEIIGHLSRLFTLQPGDLVFTGTPAGVGPVIARNRLNAEIAGLTPLVVTITAPA